MNEWISVDDRLPEQLSDAVLVRYHAHFDDEELTEFSVCVAHFGVNKFSVRDQYFYTKRKVKVTHWMPIPEFKESEDAK